MRRERLIADNAATLSIDRRSGSPGVRDRSVPEYMTNVTPVVTLIRVITTALVVIAGIIAAPGPAAAGEYPADFISALGNQGLAVIRSNAAIDQKAAYFHQMLRQDFDLARISRFGLGPYWRVASENERQEFASLLEDHLVRFYGRRFAEYGGESLRVTGSRTDADGVIVASQIIRQEGSPIAVEWRLGLSDGHYKISDVIVDGVSMALTQRSEFAAMIQRNGGQVAGLLTAMRAEN
jgi:phospholipid transport system substrate-binding protein